MRYVYAFLMGVLVVALAFFAIQNLSNVTVEFLTMSATLPLALVVAIAYLAGMVSGGSLLALLRNWRRSAGRGAAGRAGV
jgi:uncharacterized integral membrane protein